MTRPITFLWVAMSFVAATSFAAEVGIPPEVLEKHAKQVAAALPDGWTVSVEQAYGVLSIERARPVTMIDGRPSGPMRMPGDPPFTDKVRILLRVLPVMSKADIEAAKKHNADREKALEMLRTQMNDLRASVKPSWLSENFEAKTPEQKARLDAFVAVKQALPEKFIPELFARDASFRLEEDAYLTPTDETVRMEIKNVRQKVEALYAKAPLN